jgi:hypothetical protein
MPFSLYHAVVPLWNRLLPSLSHILVRAEAHCEEAGIAPSELLEARLAPDMWDFASQVHAAVVHSATALEAALTGDFVPTFSSPPSGIAALDAAVTAAAASIAEIDPALLDARAGHEVTAHFGERRMPFLAEAFLTGFSLPNFAFHATTAYNILRMKGVPLGKMDFLGALPVKD